MYFWVGRFLWRTLKSVELREELRSFIAWATTRCLCEESIRFYHLFLIEKYELCLFFLDRQKCNMSWDFWICYKSNCIPGWAGFKAYWSCHLPAASSEWLSPEYVAIICLCGVLAALDCIRSTELPCVLNEEPDIPLPFWIFPYELSDWKIRVILPSTEVSKSLTGSHPI